MKHKISLLLGVAVGYVAGAAAGRQRYEQLKARAADVWSDPRVQDAVTTAQAKAVDGAKGAAGAVREKVASGGATGTSTGGTGGSGSTGSTGSTGPADTGTAAGDPLAGVTRDPAEHAVPVEDVPGRTTDEHGGRSG